jgi:hypothetical protein
MTKAARAQYTLEYKQEAVRLVDWLNRARASRQQHEVWEWLNKRCTTG